MHGETRIHCINMVMGAAYLVAGVPGQMIGTARRLVVVVRGRNVMVAVSWRCVVGGGGRTTAAQCL